MSAKKLALILPDFNGGGAERVMLTIARNVDRARFKPVLIVLQERGALRDLVPDDVTIICLKTRRLRRTLPMLIAALRRERPDIVLSTMAYMNFAVCFSTRLALGKKCRLVLREANMPSATIARVKPAWLVRVLYRLLYPWADTVVCNARPVADELRQVGVPDWTIHILPNPVDTDRIRFVAEVGECGDLVQVQDGGRLFVGIGRLIEQKGFDRLIEWFTAMPASDRLVIFGEGPLRRMLNDSIIRLGLKDRVLLAGFVKSPWACLKQADAFVMPSRWEGLPNAALEALALGTPVIATSNTGGLPDIVNEVRNGMLVIADGKDEFVSAMGAVRPLGADGSRVSALPHRFAVSSVVMEYESVLDGVDG
ncbi:glycosyltransferase [Rhodospirillaceae bacterium KN72]|uniref:Glycosyltransferase n=1 Tax=Pacificispira spongiicola TaxID=2729598 RepID=A0A7Y0E1U7_9PROT|nr:glycosyltransferase [Pacificispira spongiicola]NMM45603.1 glycosyltransferase [Pacificispira spongiicola]